MRGGWKFAAGLMLTLAGGAAQAQQLTADQDAIAAELKAKGYKAEMIKGDKSDYIRSADSGVPITIYFNDCTKGRRGCATVQFYTGFTDIEPTADQMNSFNAEQRWVRAYIDSDKDPVLEMDVNMDFGGLSRELFWDNLRTYFAVVARFREQHRK